MVDAETREVRVRYSLKLEHVPFPVRVRAYPQIYNLKFMIKEIVIDESYKTVDLFDSIKVGDIYKVPYDDSRHRGIKMEAARRNRDARLEKRLKAKMDLMYRVSKIEYPGFTSVIRLK